MQRKPGASNKGTTIDKRNPPSETFAIFSAKIVSFSELLNRMGVLRLSKPLAVIKKSNMSILKLK